MYHIPIFCIRKMLNNIKLEPLNPSKSQIIHKNTYYTITKYVHINCKVCTHTDTLFYDGKVTHFQSFPQLFTIKM